MHLRERRRFDHTATGRRALRCAAGFTLIELLVVVIVIGILVAIAVPAYGSLTGRARNGSAAANIREALPSVEAFHLDNDTYVGLGNSKKKTPPGLTYYDPAVDATVGTGAKGKPTATSFCLNATSGSTAVSMSGPAPFTWFTHKNCAGAGSATAPS